MKKDATLFQIVTNNAEAKSKIDSSSFCLVAEKENHLKIFYYDKLLKKPMVWETSSIISKEVEDDIIIVRTRNSKYFLTKWINDIQTEIEEHYFLDMKLRLREAKEKALSDLDKLSMTELIEIINTNR